MDDNSTISEKMSGYELAEKVLLHYISREACSDSFPEEDTVLPDGVIDMFLELSGNDENDWFELKAAMYPSEADEKKGVTDKDVFWHNEKAVLSLMNTSGGALVIGISEEDHSVVPLRGRNDPNHLIKGSRMGDYFRQEILDRLRPIRNRSWAIPKTNNSQQDGSSQKQNENREVWTIEDAVEEDMIKVYGCMYQNEVIAVVLVKATKDPVLVRNSKESYRLLHRVPGDVGEVSQISHIREIKAYIDKREKNGFKEEKYTALYKLFLRKIESESAGAKLNEKIENYYKRFEKEINDRKYNHSYFTSLDASGNLSDEGREDDYMVSLAGELVEHDRWDDEDEENEENEDFDGNPSKDEEENASRYREKRSGDLLKLLHEIPRIAVLGEPGGGKTTTLEYFTIQFHEPENRKQTLAFFISMGQWQNGDTLGLLLKKRVGLDPAEWQRLIDDKRLRLVIDAVNECPDSFRKSAVMIIRSFLREYPDLPVVISARTDEDLKKLRLPATFSVQPMDTAHQLNYLTSYLKNPKQAQTLLERLRDMPGSMEIVANPLLMLMVVGFYKKNSGGLPTGRTDLYRSWIEQWYKAEKRKAKKMDEPLPWDFDNVFEIFSELAFQSRLLGGYRDVPLETRKAFLEKFGEDCITRLCHGPIITADEDINSIRFWHETFQEYLCAEYLIRHPDALPSLTRADSAKWGMPLAYAAELCWPLPEPLWHAALAIDPWFGFAVTDDERLGHAEEIVRVSKQDDPFVSQVLSICLPQADKTISISLKNNIQSIESWYSNVDPKLVYVLLTNETVKQRWLKVDFALLNNTNKCKNICFVLTHSMVLKQFAGYSINRTIRNILEAGKELFPLFFAERLQEFETIILTKATILNAVTLVRKGFASKEDFKDRIDVWIATPTPRNVSLLIQNDFVSKDVFNDQIEKWIRDANYKDAIRLVNYDLASKEDFVDRIDKWISEFDPDDVKGIMQGKFIPFFEEEPGGLAAFCFIQNNLASKEVFHDIIEKWIEKAAPMHAEYLIQKNLTSKEDFKAKIEIWISEADLCAAIDLIQRNLASKEDFKDKTGDWISNANLKTAKILIQNGLASKEDFKDKTGNWISNANLKTAKIMIQIGLASREDFKDKTDNWISNANLKMAKYMIRYGFASREDFKDKTGNWISNADFKTAKYMIRNGFASREDFKDKTGNWISNADFKTAKIMIRYGLASKEDFRFLKVTYLIADLNDPFERERIQNDLAGKKWEMKVIFQGDDYSFLTAPQFPDNVFCMNYLFSGGPVTAGSVWSVEIFVRYNKKKEIYSFCAKSAEFVSSGDQ